VLSSHIAKIESKTKYIHQLYLFPQLSGGYILVSCAHSNTSYIQTSLFIDLDPSSTDNADNYAQLDSLCLIG
jgi:hypothetical protein